MASFLNHDADFLKVLSPVLISNEINPYLFLYAFVHDQLSIYAQV